MEKGTYFERNRVKVLASQKERYHRNKGKVNIVRRERYKNRNETASCFHLEVCRFIVNNLCDRQITCMYYSATVVQRTYNKPLLLDEERKARKKAYMVEYHKTEKEKKKQEEATTQQKTIKEHKDFLKKKGNGNKNHSQKK